MLLGIRWGSLRAKIIAWVFFPTAIILTSVALVTFAAYRQVTGDLVIQRNQELILRSASQLTVELGEYADLLAAEARTASFYQDDPAAQRSALQQAGNRLAVFDGGVLILDSRGTVVATQPERLEALGQDWSNRPYFRQMLRSPGPVFSGVVSDGPGGTQVIVVAVPIAGDQDELLGIVAGMFRLGETTANAFYGDIVKLRAGKSGSVYLVDGNGLIIYHANLNIVGDNLSAHVAMQPAYAGLADTIRTRGVDGRPVVASFAPVPGTNWKLVTQESLAALLMAHQGYGLFLLVLLVLGVGTPAGVVTIGVRRITKPITELIVAAQEVAEGNFSRTITTQTGDEIEELAEQFNLMSTQLQKSYARMEQRLAERKQAEEALRISESRYQQATSAGRVGVWEWDIKTNEMYVAPNLKAMLGYEDHEIENTFAAWAGLIHPDDAEMVAATLLDYIEGRTPVYEVERRMMHKNGSVRWISGCGTAIKYDRDKPSRMTGTDTDITEKKQIEEAERQQRMLAEALRDTANVLNSTLDLEEVLDRILSRIGRVVPHDAANIMLIEETGVARIVRGRGYAERGLAEAVLAARFQLADFPALCQVIETGQPSVIVDAREDPDWTETPESHWVRSLIGVPIRLGEQVIGLINLDSATPGFFTPAHADRLLAFADQAAVAIQNARLYEQVQRHADRLEEHVAERTAELEAANSQLMGQIAERMRVEEALIESEKKYHSLYSSMSEGVALHEVIYNDADEAVDYRILDVNPAYESILGLSRENAIGAKASELYGTGEPPYIDRFAQVAASGRPTSFETTFEPMEKTFRISIISPRKGQFATVFTDITERRRTEESEREQRALAEALRDTAAALSSTLDHEEVLDRILANIGRVVPNDVANVMLIERGNAHVVRHRGYAERGLEEWLQALRFPIADTANLRQMAESGQPLVIPDARNYVGWVDIPESRWMRSYVGAPICLEGQTIGFLNLDNATPGTFRPAHAEHLQAFADQAAIAIKNARLYETEERRAEQFQVISEVGQQITSILPVSDLLWDIARLIKETLGYYLVGIALIEGDELVFKAGVGGVWETPDFQPPRLIMEQEGITGWVARNNEPLLVPDVRQDPRNYFLPEASEIRSELAVPLETKATVIGVMHAQSDHLDAFDESDLAVLQSLANQAAVAIENARLFEQAKKLAAMEERQRLARDLHDAVTQTIWSAALTAEVLPQVWARDPDEGLRRLETLHRLARGALAEMRTLLLELRPDTLGSVALDTLLGQLATAITTRTGVPVALEIKGQVMLSPDVRIGLYRIAQEAINNVAKHAQASQVMVRLCHRHGLVELTVEDDGCGFDLDQVPPGHLGLGIIRERAEAIGAALDITSKIGQGTKITVSWPVKQREEDS